MKRFGMTVMLKDNPEAIRKYEEYHANPWPEVGEASAEAGVKRAYIYRFGRQLFLFLETKDGFDLERDGAKYVEYHPKVREWDELMRPFQEPVPGAPEGATWVQMKEIHVFEAPLGD